MAFTIQSASSSFPVIKRDRVLTWRGRSDSTILPAVTAKNCDRVTLLPSGTTALNRALASVFLFALLLFLPIPLSARQSTDLIVMNNGDKFTCTIKGLEDGVLYVSLDYVVQTLSVDWSKVANVESAQLFLVKTQDGSVYRGTLKTLTKEGDKPVRIQVVETSESPAAIEQGHVIEIAQTSNSFWQRFSGAVNSGMTYSKGNENVQYTLGSNVEYLRQRWGAGASWNSNLSYSSGTTTSTRNQIALTGRRLLPWNNWFYQGLGDFLQSSVQGIDLQTSAGGGLGRYLTNTNRATVAVVGGFAWQNTNYTQSTFSPGTQNLAAGLVAVDARLFKFNKTNLNVTAVIFPVLNDPGRVKFNTNATYYIKITGDLSWNVSFYGNWDNQPPPHFVGSDYGTSSGLSLTFGIK